MATNVSARTVLVVNGRRFVLASDEEIEQLRTLKMSYLLAAIGGRWFIDDGKIGTPPIRMPSPTFIEME